MKTVYKYVLDETEQKVKTFEGVRFLHVANQHGDITVWAEVETERPECMTVLYVVGTGEEVPDGATTYIGSALMASGNFVFHIYQGDEVV